jgi:2,3,4,5-tetrahydropyridine-2-carboxylate N-succinyltransferase
VSADPRTLSVEDLAEAIEGIWASTQADPDVPLTPSGAAAVEETIRRLDTGEVRVAEPPGGDDPGGWVVNRWAKEAVLLYFRVRGLETTDVGPFEYRDRLPLKSGYAQAGVRVVPPATARYGAHLEPGVVLMPSYVNIGAWVGSGTMVDTWATVGSCAQIGRDVHLAGGVGIGGVLEPIQAAPVVIGDGAFIGSRCIVVEGVRVGEGAVLGAGVVVTGNTPVIDVTGDEPVEHRGSIPAGAIVVPGSRPKEFAAGAFGLPAGLIIGYRNRATEDKVALNALLREFGSSLS